MHRTFGYLSKRLIQIRTGEGRKVFLTFLYFFLVITAYYIIKPVSRSLVLGELGSRLVPYVDLISALLMGPMVTLFARLVDRIEKRRLVSLTFWAIVASLLVFWKLLAWPMKWIPATFYVWVSIFSVLVVTLFWLVANDLYRPREAKRLFGFIGSGGILGGVVGSSIAAIGARWIGTEQLLVCSAATLLVCWLVVQRLWRLAPAATMAEQPVPARHDTFLSNVVGFVRLVGRSRYLLLLVGLVGIAKIVSTLIYYQFNPFIEQMFPDRDMRTAFTGVFFGWMNVASFVVQFFFTSWILRRLGLACALLVLPVGLLGGSIGLLLIPGFWLAATTELYDASLNYSLQQTSKEVLYLPIDRSIRYKVKPFIDMVVFRFGKGIAAIVGILCLDVLHLEARVLSYLTVPLVLGWLVVALWLRRDYVTAIRSIVQARAVSRRGRDRQALRLQQRHGPLIEDAELEEWLESLSPSHAVQQKLTLVGQLFSMNGSLSEEARKLLEALAHYEQRPTHPPVPRQEASAIEHLKECLRDGYQPMAKRCAAIRQLIQQGGQEAVDCLLGMLMVEDDPVMRQELLRGLTKLRLLHPRLEFPKRLIRRQIAREAQAYQRMVQIAAVYRRACGRVSDGDPVLGLLRILLEETMQRIFRFLSLVYRPDDIYLIYNQLREPEAYVRADAIELLDNLIDPGLRWLISPILDENTFLARVEAPSDEPVPEGKEAYQLLQEGVRDHDRWLSIMILSVAGRLRLEPLIQQELQRLTEHQDHVIVLAAKAARHLSAASSRL